MTYNEAKAAVEKFQGKMDASFSNADKKKIEELYSVVLRKTFVHTSCQQCYHDAVIEMMVYLRKYRKLKTKCNYRMRAGFIISCPDFYAGRIFTNETLTDKVAKEYLEKYPKQAAMFSEIPKEEINDESPADTGEEEKTTGTDDSVGEGMADEDAGDADKASLDNDESPADTGEEEVE